MRAPSTGRFRYLLFGSIAIALLAFIAKANAIIDGQNHSAAASGSLKAIAQGLSQPIILYTDITSGPNSGGEGNNGTYLTVFGNHFGTTQGTSKVAINGKAVAKYLLWSDKKIGLQVGPVSSGPIVVTVGGASSNSDLTFKVRSGHLYYIGAGADNSPPGSCSSMMAANSYSIPWGLTNIASTMESSYSFATMRTPYTYYKCLSFGDTLVFLNGASYHYYDGRGWHASLTPDKKGAGADSFITFMARPGARAQLGGESGAMFPVRDISDGYDVFSGFTLTGRGKSGGAEFRTNVRLVGNEITCPDCSGPAGAVSGGDGLTMYGNTVHDVGVLVPGGAGKLYHAIYVAGNNIDIGWNKIYNTKAYNGIQVNHDGSPGFYNLAWHDNDISDVNGSGINLSTIDPSSGYVMVYNNVIHHVGLNIASDGSTSDPHSCIAVKGYGRSTGSGTVEIFNNTMYDCSSYLNVNPASQASCAIIEPFKQLNARTNLVNNIVYQPVYTVTAKQNVFICGGVSMGTLSGSNNLWYSESPAGSAAPVTTFGVIANPSFLSASDLHVRRGSPAVGHGASIGDLKRDHDGAPRANPPTIGAYE